MVCPECGSQQEKVINSRPIPDRDIRFRRHRCLDCYNTWSTFEVGEKELMRLFAESESGEDVFRRMRGSHD